MNLLDYSHFVFLLQFSDFFSTSQIQTKTWLLILRKIKTSEEHFLSSTDQLMLKHFLWLNSKHFYLWSIFFDTWKSIPSIYSNFFPCKFSFSFWIMVFFFFIFNGLPTLTYKDDVVYNISFIKLAKKLLFTPLPRIHTHTHTITPISLIILTRKGFKSVCACWIFLFF